MRPESTFTDYTDLFGNRSARAFLPRGRTTFRNDFVVEDNGLPDPQAWNAIQHNVEHLPDAADVPLTTSFGLNTLSGFKVWTDEQAAAIPAPVA